MSWIKNKIKINRQILNIKNTIYTSNINIKNKENEDIIIPEPKKKIQRRIFGNEIDNEISSFYSESDSETNKKNRIHKFEELNFIREIPNLSFCCKNIIKNENKIQNEMYGNNYILNEKNKSRNKYEITKYKENENINCKNEFLTLKYEKNIFNSNSLNEMDISDDFTSEKEQLDKQSILIDKFLPCRKEEQLKIYKYIKNGLKTKGDYNSLYLGGMPGTGKTECINNVIKIIEMENKENYDIKFRVLFINCVNYPKTTKFIKLIYNFIFSKKKKEKIKTSKYIKLLNEFFLERKKYNGNIYLKDPSNSHIILIIDEIDYIINKSQYLLYHIFNWTTYSDSKLIVISISNLLNISNKLLPKINSRFGQNRIMFKPYTKEQIIKILKYKGIELNEFDEDALKLSSMKVAAVNGDLRRIFLILNKAKEIFESDIEINKAEKNSLINKFYIIRAFNELFDCKTVNMIKHFTIIEKIIISGILYRNIKDNNNFVKIDEIYNSLNILIYKYNEYISNKDSEININWQEFQKIIYCLLRAKIIEINDNEFINFKNNYIHIKFYIDEFMIACESDLEYKPIFNFLTNIIS